MTQREFLGDYELLKQIGKGPLGAVYHARHRFLKKYYALHMLPEELMEDGEFVKRFENQIAQVSHIHHENIVHTHNVSQADGKYFIVSDLTLDGAGEYCTLAKFLKTYKKVLDEEKLFSLLYQIASAIDHLHSGDLATEGLAHRYVNLHSILVGKEGETSLEVFLKDVGLAAIIGEGGLLSRTYQMMTEALSFKKGGEEYILSGMDSGKITQLHETFLASYPFLAPEQKEWGQGALAQSPADVYAFGVLAYYLLLREFPEGFFALPSATLPFKYNWDQLIFQCLKRDPAKRPQSLIQVMEGVKEIDRPVQDDVIDQWKSSQSVNVNEQIKSVSDIKAAPRTQQPSIKDIVAEISEEKAIKKAPAPVTPPIENNIAPSAQAQATPFTQAPTGLLTEEEPHLKPKLNPQELEKPEFEPDPGLAFQSETVISTYKPEEKESVDLEPIPTEMVVVPGGEFYRGSNEGARDEKPYHKINVSSFAIDSHPVTNEQFVLFLEVMGGEKDRNNNDMIRFKDARIKRSGGKMVIESGYQHHPVVGVTWYGAIAYAKWVGKRLPTEAEWEIAARSLESERLYPTGNAIEKTQANFFSSDTTAVKSYDPNEIGLYDMAGNVYEWCEDWYDYAYYDVSELEPNNPTGPHQGVYRVLRGGCWKSLQDDLRCSHRHRNNPGSFNSTYGFRCASDVTEDA